MKIIAKTINKSPPKILCFQATNKQAINIKEGVKWMKNPMILSLKLASPEKESNAKREMKQIKSIARIRGTQVSIFFIRQDCFLQN